MRCRLAALVVLVLALSTLPVAAVSTPVVTGNISGVELCPQSICGEAVFAGSYIGQVNARPASGVFWAGITHEPLPTVTGTTADITGGTWLIRTRRNVFFGNVTSGTLTYNGSNTFSVTLTLVITRGGSGALTFAGSLDHNPFPPTIIGTISQ